ncbi:MAG: hypothetical protein U0183_24265 [Polyangiaceae bacterium]
MTYRSSACAFCENVATLACPRCAQRVCATHGPERHAHCAECERERVYLVEVAETEEILRSPEIFEGRGYRGDQISTSINIARLLANAVSRPFRRRRARREAEREFQSRTPEAIAAWRAQGASGIVTSS